MVTFENVDFKSVAESEEKETSKMKNEYDILCPPLKKCPFCGGEVKMEYWSSDYPVTFAANGYEIKCKKCNIGFSGTVPTLPQFCPEKTEKLISNLAKKWNRRIKK